MSKGSKQEKEEGQGVTQDDNDKAQTNDQELFKTKPIVDSSLASQHLNSLLDNMSDQDIQKANQKHGEENMNMITPQASKTPNLDIFVSEQLDALDDEFGFGLEDDDELNRELDRLAPLPLPMQKPSTGRTRRRRLIDAESGDQLPARRVKSTELLAADELSRYLHEIRRYPLLEREEEKRLAENYFHHEDRDSAKKLVTGNLRLVVKIAKQYRRAWVNIMDLIQEGNIGLGEAVKRFDPYRGVRFSSFARYWIRALILQFILKNFRMVSFANTRAGRKLFFRLEKERTRLMQLYGEATTSQLALALDVSEEDVETAIRLNQPILSLDAPRYQDENDGESLGNLLPDESQGLDLAYEIQDYKTLIHGHINDFGATLSDERELVIWKERLLSDEPESLAVLGERFQVTRERVRQLELRLKKRLKAYLDEHLDSEVIMDLEKGF
jgi:RNA polymerase sigma-32 factor